MKYWHILECFLIYDLKVLVTGFKPVSSAVDFIACSAAVLLNLNDTNFMEDLFFKIPLCPKSGALYRSPLW